MDWDGKQQSAGAYPSYARAVPASVHAVKRLQLAVITNAALMSSHDATCGAAPPRDPIEKTEHAPDI